MGRGLFFLYLNGASYRDDPTFWTSLLWNQGNPEEWAQAQSLDDDPLIRFASKKGVWACADNILSFSKAQNGSLDVPGTRNMLTRFKAGFEGWQFQIRKVNREDVALAIEMGVPQLSNWAKGKDKDKDNEIPAVSIGDTFWSRTLLGSLVGAGEYDEETKDAIHTIAECEKTTSEAWLFPIVAPRDYASFLTEAQIPFHHLPGFFGARPDEKEVSLMRSELALKSARLVVMSSGMTEVWETIYREVGNLVEQAGTNINFALLYLYPTRHNLCIIDQGERRSVPQSARLLPIYANADLGITRGGITVIEFIAAGLPFVVVQEPNHWLSQQQQSAVSQSQLGHSASLSLLQDHTKVLGLIARYLDATSQNKKMKARQEFFEFGIEEKWASLLLDSWARWHP